MNVLLWTSYFDIVNLIFKLSEVGLEIKAATIIHIETRKRGPLTSDVSIWAYVCRKHSKYNWRSLLVAVFVKSGCYRRHMIWSNYIWASVSCSAFTHYIRLLRLLIVLFHFRNWVRWKQIGNAMKSNQRIIVSSSHFWKSGLVSIHSICVYRIEIAFYALCFTYSYFFEQFVLVSLFVHTFIYSLFPP